MGKPWPCKNSTRYNRTWNFAAHGHAESKNSEKIVFRSALRPNQISFLHGLLHLDVLNRADRLASKNQHAKAYARWDARPFCTFISRVGDWCRDRPNIRLGSRSGRCGVLLLDYLQRASPRR